MSDQELLHNYSKHMLYITKGDTCSIGIVITRPQEYYRNYCTRLLGVMWGPCAIIAIVFLESSAIMKHKISESTVVLSI